MATITPASARLAVAVMLLVFAAPAFADAPVASYLFPAGGKRGTTVPVRVGGLNLFDRCRWEVIGKGLTASNELTRIPTVWFEGPVLPLPDSQRQEDYPADMRGEVRIADDAPLGIGRARLWTSEGASGGLRFMVGDLPEVVEDEAKPGPHRVTLPVTINGRIFPREDNDDWAVEARKGQTITAEAFAERVGSKLDPRLEVFAPTGERIAENDDARGTDSLVRFTAPADGTYRIRISDSQRGGSQAHVYRLTVTAGPVIDHVFPAGGKAGRKVRLTLLGANLPRDSEEVTLPATKGRHEVRLPASATLDVDDLAEFVESAAVNNCSLPCVVNGRIAAPGEVDAWRFTAKKGQAIEYEVRPVGSPLLPVIEIEKDGKPVASQGRAASGLFTPPADGQYVLRVRDQFRSRGGPAFIYRVRLAPPEPDFSFATLTDAEGVLRGKSVKVKVKIDRRGGLNVPVEITAQGLPKGVTLKPAKVGPGQPQFDLTFDAAREAAIDAARITLKATAKVGDRTIERTDEVLLGVGLPAPFKYRAEYDLRLAPRGSVFRKKYTIDRGDYTGPLEARLADRQGRHLQGVTGPVLTVPAGVNEFEYPVTLPPWMEIGRTSRANVILIGKVKDGGREHTVSWSGNGQNEQIIAVVETGRLGLEVGRASVAGKKGETVSVPLSVRRGKDVSGPVRVEIAGCKPVVIAAGESSGVLTVPVTSSRSVLIRATLEVPGGVMAAEATLEVVAE